MENQEIKFMPTFTEKWGDLIKEASNYDAIVHGCNCFNSMGAGIAAGVAKVYPEADRVDKQSIYGDINKLGTIEHVIIRDKNVIVVNAYTQFTPGKDVSYAAIEMVLRKLNKDFEGRHIALPMIGCGIAGGYWEIVYNMMKRILKDVSVTIIYWEGEYDKFNGVFPSVIQ